MFDAIGYVGGNPHLGINLHVGASGILLYLSMGRSALTAEKDDVALKVYKAYMDLVYCLGAIEQVEKKRDESRALLHQTDVMAEVGQKSGLIWRCACIMSGSMPKPSGSLMR